MRQRVMLAMALCCNPGFLIADEPTTALDVTIQATILELITGMIERLGMSLLFITHNLGVVAHACDRVGVMYASHIVELGDTREIFANPQHPYTVGLLNSIPRLDGHAKYLTPIAGSVCNMMEPPSGCKVPSALHPRHGVCRREIPPLEGVAPGHLAACHLHDRGTDGDGGGGRRHPAAGQGADQALHPARRHLFEARRRETQVLKAVDGVDFHIRRGETLGLVGESGCGKSTTARLVTRLIEPTAGEVTLEGRGHAASRAAA